MIKKLITTVALVLAATGSVYASSGGGLHYSSQVDISNTASLQRGAKLFVNYCLSCHSAKYMRYNRMGEDLGLSAEQVENNLMLASDKIGSGMMIAMAAKDAEKWFGVLPPDLSVIARAKGAGATGADWLYTYFKTFYVDESRPFGVNNAIFPNVGMPHVLEGLQGKQAAVYETTTDHDGNEHKTIVGFEQLSEGSMTPEEYDDAVRDLAAFLSYMGEPAQLKRDKIGVWVLLFLVLFTVIAYALKKEYWKDVH